MRKNHGIKLVLDTPIFLDLIRCEERLSKKSRDIISKSFKEGKIGLSAISLWEVSMLHAHKEILLDRSPLVWLEKSLKSRGFFLCPISPKIAHESSILPNQFDGNAADRIIIATARVLGAPLMTSDENILKYSKNVYLSCIKA